MITLFRATFLILDPVCRGGKRREQCGHSECPSDRLQGSRHSRKDKKINFPFIMKMIRNYSILSLEMQRKLKWKFPFIVIVSSLLASLSPAARRLGETQSMSRTPHHTRLQTPVRTT